MKKVLLNIIFLITALASYSQQDAQFTDYMYNTITVNPAYAGSRNVLSVFALTRQQWVGLDGAPVTNNLSVNTPIKNTRLGLGFSVINDKIGPSLENTFSTDVSYTVPTSESFKLSFGIKGSANLLNIDFSKLNIYNSGDNQAQYNIDNKFSPNIGAGVYLHSDKTYVGLSVPAFLQTKHFDKNAANLASASVLTNRMHLYFISGHVFDLSPEIKFKPALLSKIVTGAPLQMDLSANFLFNEKFSAGVAYRWNSAVSALAGFQISDSWFVGYAYDGEVTKLSNYNSGSHEFFLRWELFRNYDKFVSPRFF